MGEAVRPVYSFGKEAEKFNLSEAGSINLALGSSIKPVSPKLEGELGICVDNNPIDALSEELKRK